MSEERLHRVELNLPALAHGELPDMNKAAIIIDGLPILAVQKVTISADIKGTLVTVAFFAEITGQVDVVASGLKLEQGQ